MKTPSRTTLLRELDALSHPARMASLGKLGHAEASDPKLEELISELARGDWYEAWLAVRLAFAARLPRPLVAALAHPSVRVRSAAAAVAPRICGDDQLEAALDGLPPDTRKRLVKGIAIHRRTALAERLYPRLLLRHGAHEAAILLSALGPALLGTALGEVGHVVQSWQAIAKRQPEALLAFVRRQAEGLPRRDRTSLFTRHAGALRALARVRPAEVLALAWDHAPAQSVPEAVVAVLGMLTRAQPEQVVRLLERPALRAWLRGQVPRGVLQNLDALSVAQRERLAVLLAEAPDQLARLLEHVAPGDRAALFQAAYPRTPPRLPPETLLRALPHALRDAQAVRMLGLKEIQDDPERLRVVQAYRAIEQSRPLLAEATRAAKAEDRAHAVRWLIRSTGFSRRGLAETLASLSRLKNDQDPVRNAAVFALAELPPTLIGEAHLPALARLVEWVVEARDTSGSTRAGLQTLAFRLIQANAAAPDGPHFQFALQTLRRLGEQTGRLALPPLERNLPRGAELRIVSTLLPLMREASDREDYQLILALAAALGRRAWSVDLLQALIKPALNASPEWVARAAHDLWLAPPRTRDGRVRELLARDKTTVSLPAVFEHLHRRRQEWLDPFLGGRPLKGRFLEGKGGFVPPATEGFFRWLPRQQVALAELLVQIAADGKRSAMERAGVLRVFPRLQSVDLERLRPFLESTEVPVREAALGALPWLDRPAPGLGPLMAELDTDRARVAIYALPGLARRVPSGVLAEALGALLAREKLRVTVHKEALRLLGSFRSEQSLPLLQSAASRPGLHRDVRIALGHAARQLLDDERAWTLVETLARDAEPAIARSLLDQQPLALPAGNRARFGALVVALAQHVDGSVRQAAFAVLQRWSAGIEDTVGPVALARVVELGSGPEWREAAKLLVSLARETNGARYALGAAETLLRADQPDATLDRDFPARQRLGAICDAFVAEPVEERLGLAATLSGLAARLAPDASLWSHRAALLLATLSWREREAAQALIQELAAEIRTEPLYAQVLADRVGQGLAAAPGWEPGRLLELAQTLDQQPLVALQLVVAAGTQARWPPEACAALRTLRAHPSAGIRAAARGVLLYAET